MIFFIISNFMFLILDGLRVCDGTQECKQDVFSGVSIHCTGADACEDSRITLLADSSRLYCHRTKACATSRVTCAGLCAISCQQNDSCKSARFTCNSDAGCYYYCSSTACDGLTLRPSSKWTHVEQSEIQSDTKKSDLKIMWQCKSACEQSRQDLSPEGYIF